MSYHFTTTQNSAFVMTTEQAEKAYHALKNSTNAGQQMKEWNIPDGVGGFCLFLNNHGFEYTLDEDRDVFGFYVSNANLRSQKEHIFDVIAPHVSAGNFFEFSGGDGTMWRWFFDGRACIEQSPTTTWG